MKTLHDICAPAARAGVLVSRMLWLSARSEMHLVCLFCGRGGVSGSVAGVGMHRACADFHVPALLVAW